MGWLLLIKLIRKNSISIYTSLFTIDDTGACGYQSSSSDEDDYNYFQDWWRFVRRWAEKQQAYACMTKAMKLRAVIDKNQNRISELNKELHKLYVETANLQEECHKTFGGAIHYYKHFCSQA